jgi:hypothetical protein
MNQLSTDQFWSSEFAARVRHPAPLRALLDAFSGEPEKLYDLTFHASFAHKLYTVMRREGKDAQGFPRMQQSFSEAVQLTRDLIRESAAKGFSQAIRYTELSPEGMTKLLEMIGDLAIVKDWQRGSAEVL